MAKVSAENALKNTPQKPVAPGAAAPAAPGASRGSARPSATSPPTSEPKTMIRHDAQGKGILTWAAESARLLALSTSSVLRRLDNQSLSIDDTAPRGKPSSRAPEMPGGGVNPYESGSRMERGSRAPTARDAQPARTAPLPGRGGPGARRPASAPARSSWWQRLCGRD